MNIKATVLYSVELNLTLCDKGQKVCLSHIKMSGSESSPFLSTCGDVKSIEGLHWQLTLVHREFLPYRSTDRVLKSPEGGSHL